MLCLLCKAKLALVSLPLKVIVVNLAKGEENNALAPEMQRVAAVWVKALCQVLQGARENLLPRHHCIIAAAMVNWGESPCQKELAAVGLR